MSCVWKLGPGRSLSAFNYKLVVKLDDCVHKDDCCIISYVMTFDMYNVSPFRG